MTTITPKIIFGQIQQQNYSIKHVQDVSMLVYHHIMMLHNMIVCDSTHTPIPSLPSTWNNGPNVVFLRYCYHDGDAKYDIVTKFGKKENGTIDCNFKATGPNDLNVKKTFNIKTLTINHLGGHANNTNALDVDMLSQNPDCVKIFNEILQTVQTSFELMKLDHTKASGHTASISNETGVAHSTNTPPVHNKTEQSSSVQTQPRYFMHTPLETPTQHQSDNPHHGSSPSIPTMSASTLPINPVIHEDRTPSQDHHHNNHNHNHNQQQQHQNPSANASITLPKLDTGIKLPGEPKSATISTSNHPSSTSLNKPQIELPPTTIQDSKPNSTQHNPPIQPPNPIIHPNSPQPTTQPHPQQPGPVFDPYTGQMTDRGFNGPNDARLGGGLGGAPTFNDPFQGGNLMGPDQLRQFPHGNNGPAPRGGNGFPPGSRGPPGPNARFDPFGPLPGMGDPDNDQLKKPKQGGSGSTFNGGFF
jgi:hypothetical protein